MTEYGDPDGGFGYLFGQAGTTSFAYRPALAIDRSDRDDPDYMFLAFVGGNRPGPELPERAGRGGGLMMRRPRSLLACAALALARRAAGAARRPRRRTASRSSSRSWTR